jgi:hypothetical protein
MFSRHIWRRRRIVVRTIALLAPLDQNGGGSVLIVWL